VKSIFTRIFLSFWATTAFIIVTSILITASVAWHRWGQLQNIDMSALAGQAAEQFAQDGTEGLRQWTREVERQHIGLRVYVVNTDGLDVAGRQLTEGWERYVKRMRRLKVLAPKPDVTQAEITDRLGMTPRLTTADGSVFMLLPSYAGWPPFNVLRTPDVIFIVIGLALAVSGFMSWWLARFVSNPVKRLQSAARSLAAGDFEARVGDELVTRRDELGVLAVEFNRMADHVWSLVSSKETLLSGMSHELRSPLARLRVALGLARRKDADTQKQFDRIDLEAERLDTLIGQMLQLSYLRGAAPSHAREAVDLMTLVSEVVDDARLEAGASGKRVAWQPGATAIVEGDPGLLRSAIENVLRNAVRFTAADTAVIVDLATVGHEVVLTIRDHGPGVPEHELGKIFDPFHRVAPARDRESGGTGLGLAITAGVVRIHSGSVRAQNAASGGLTVELRFPVISGAAAASSLIAEAAVHLRGPGDGHSSAPSLRAAS
jgi:two-component system, OmpR family, sensor kinase